MKNYPLNAYRYAAGISLLIVSNYFFQYLFGHSGDKYSYLGDTPDIKELYISGGILFIFCLVISRYILNLYVYEKLNSIISILLVSWLIALAFKTLILISGNKWEQIRVIFFENENSRILRVIWYLMPIIASLIFLSLKKNKLSLGIVLCSTLGFSYLITGLFRVFSYEPGHFIEKANKISTYTNYNKNRKVYWILFDEFDPELAFSEKTELDGFKKLMLNSVFHTKIYPPSRDTIYSIPALLIGSQTLGNVYHGLGKLDLINEKKQLVPFEFNNTIFGKLDQQGISSALLGFYHPYCNIFGAIQCQSFIWRTWAKIYWFDGLLSITPFPLIDRFFDDGLSTYFSEHTGIKQQSNYAMLNITKQQIDLIPEFIHSKKNLFFLHLNIPHLPADYAKQHFHKEVNDNLPSYLLNLKLADELLKIILANIRQDSVNQESLVILSSDHWFRDKDKKSPHPSLFIAKLNNDNHKIEINTPSSAIYIQELILDYLNQAISSHLDIKKFFENRPGYKTFIPND